MFGQKLENGRWRFYYERGPGDLALIQDLTKMLLGDQLGMGKCSNFGTRETCLSDPRTKVCTFINNRCEEIRPPRPSSNPAAFKAYNDARSELEARGYVDVYGERNPVRSVK